MPTPHEARLFGELRWIAEWVGRRMALRAPPHLREDVEAASFVGLWDCVRLHSHLPVLDVTRLAWSRCRGAVLDELRRDHPVYVPRRPGVRPTVVSDSGLELHEAFRETPQYEIILDVARAIDALPERLRSILLAYYVDGISVQDIAVAQGVSGPRISQLLHRALDRVFGVTPRTPRAC